MNDVYLTTRTNLLDVVYRECANYSHQITVVCPSACVCFVSFLHRKFEILYPKNILSYKGGGIIILLFLVPHPRDVGLASPDEVRFPPSFFVFVYCLPLSFARFFTVFSSFPYRIVGPGGSQGSRGLRPRVVSQRISHGRQRGRGTNSPINSILIRLIRINSSYL